MTKARKVTITLILSCTAVLVVWDVIVVLKSPGDTISNVMLKTIYIFPFVGYAWLVIAGHFLSIIKTKKRYIKPLVIISGVVLAYSIINSLIGYVMPSWALGLYAVLGFCVGTFTWSQRRIK